MGTRGQTCLIIDGGSQQTPSSGETTTADVQRQLLIEGELAARTRLTVVQGYSQLLERVAGGWA